MYALMPHLYRSQLKAWLFASLKLRYRKTWLGLVWVILNPVILLAVQGFVFSHVLNMESHTYALYLVSGFLPWIFVSQTLQMGNMQLRAFAPTIKAFNVEPKIIITSLAVENLFHFFISLTLIFVPLLFYFHKSPLILFLWFLSSIPLFIATEAMTFFTATSNVIFRDVNFVVSFALTVLYFFTPIFYTPNLIPEPWRFIIYLNPFSALLMPFQIPSMAGFEIGTWLWAWGRSVLTCAIFVLISTYVWKKIKSSFYLRL